jgi:PhnB protein
MIGVNPYISYKGNCQEAIDFYKKALGAELIFSQTWGESPMSEPGLEDKIMHATIKIGDSTIMMCDDPRSETPAASNISLAIGLNDVAKAKQTFNNLSDGGNVTMPLDKTFWAEAFGMLTDKFGINWMINCDSAKETDKTAAA